MIPAGPGRRVIPTGSLVVVRQRRVGLVVGPDQRFFPRPQSLFVQVGDRTLLIAVAELTAVGAGEGS